MATQDDSSSFSSDKDSVAIIGLACRFPGDATDSEKFWQMLCDGRSAVSKVPLDRWNNDGFYSGKKGRQNINTTERAHFLNGDISAFDANFFSLSRPDAIAMDPQQRLMLEVSYEAFENAGLPLDRLAGSKTGCFVGSFSHDWREMQFHDPDSAPTYGLSGMQAEMLANRLSWFFDLRGPSITLETACSSSLVGLHIACQSLKAGDCKVALVGGANLLLSPNMFLTLSNQGFLSPDGLCKAFDASADGYGRGEGFGVVILKPIEDAIRDGDPIRAVIRGTGSNQDGKTKGLTMPNGQAQEALIRETYRSVGLDLKDTGYFEAHGTGTQAGDFEELGAIARTIGAARKDAGIDKLWVGSVKTNIGHLEATAGLAGIIKAVYVLEHGSIPKNLFFENPNPRIPFDSWHLAVPTDQIPWPDDDVRRISVNSFGFGGSNAHAILDDAHHYFARRGIKLKLQDPVPTRSCSVGQESRGVQPLLLLLSSSDSSGLNRQRNALLKYLNMSQMDQGTSPDFLRDLAFTLNEKRSRLPWKSYCSASTVSQLREKLEAKDFPKVRSFADPRLAFVFTGQGAQWARMGVELLDFQVFRESVEAADAYLRNDDCTWSPLEELQREEATSNVHHSSHSQVLCTILQIALVELLRSWKILPRSVVGHSSGEIAAAYTVGAIAREDAWRIAYWRGKLSSNLTSLAPQLRGSMMAVGCSREVAETHIATSVTEGQCVVACVNAPSSVTISGDDTAVAELQTALEKKGIFARKLKVATAYHSHHMKVVEDAYLAALQGLKLRDVGSDAPQMFTSVTESVLQPSDLDASYWVRNLVSPVLFAGAVYQLARPKDEKDEATGAAVELILEIGPHSALQGPITQVLQAHGLQQVKYSSLLSRGNNAIDTVLAVAGDLVCHGLPVDMAAINGATAARDLAGHLPILVNLPPYSWNHTKTYWTESRVTRKFKQRSSVQSNSLGAPWPAVGTAEHLWRGFLRASDEPWVRDHKVQTNILYPAAGFLAMAVEAAIQVSEPSHAPTRLRLREIHFNKPIVMTEESATEVIVRLTPPANGTFSSGDAWHEFKISSSSNTEEELSLNCSGRLSIECGDEMSPAARDETVMEQQSSRSSYAAALESCTTAKDTLSFYSQLDSVGLHYGPSFRGLKNIHYDTHGRCCCTVQIAKAESEPESRNKPPKRYYTIHPTCLESMFHSALAAIVAKHGRVKGAFVVKSIDEITIDANIPSSAGAHFCGWSTARSLGFRDITSDISMFEDTNGNPTVIVKGLRLTEVPSAASDLVEDTPAKAMASKAVWAPAVDLLQSSQWKSVMYDTTQPATRDAENVLISERAAMGAVESAINRAEESRTLTVKLRNATRWITKQLKQSPNKPAGGAAGPAETKFETTLTRVLMGDLDPACLLDGSRSIREFIKRQSGMNAFPDIVISAIAHTEPRIAVLELDCDRNAAQPSFLGSAATLPASIKYTFASPNADEIERLRQGPAASTTFPVSYSTLDVEQDLGDQGIQPKSYNLIVGFNIISDAANAENIVLSLKSLLADGGRLCLVELTKPRLQALPALGILCNWWKKRDDGSARPLQLGFIHDLLSQAGFAVDFVDSDGVDPRFYGLTTIVATKASIVSSISLSRDELIVLKRRDSPEGVNALISELAKMLEAKSVSVRIISWGESRTNFKDTNVLSLLEYDTPFLNQLTEEDFAAVKDVVTETTSLSWVTALGEPHCSTVTGFARVLCSEISGLRFRTLQLSLETSLSGADSAAEIVYRFLSSTTADNEFKEESGFINISRIMLDHDTSQQLSKLAFGEAIELRSLGTGGEPKELCVRNPGMLDSLFFRSASERSVDLEDDEVEIQVRASGLNFRDVMVLMDQISDELLGFEASGVVLRVGRDVTEFKSGDKICTLTHGAHRTVLRSKSDACQHIPQGLSFEEAACLPLAHCTAYHALVNVAHAQKGQSILVHAAAGGVGQAAIQLAQHLGLELFATVGSPEKRDLLHEKYHIPHSHIFYSRDASFAKGVLRLTDGKGVDCILNSLSGEMLRHTWYCLAPFGTFVEIGMKDLLGNAALDMRPFLKDTTFAAIDLKYISKARPGMLAELLRNTFHLLRQGFLKPITPLTVYPASRVEDAMRLMQAGKHLGKIALSYSPQDVVPMLYNPNTAVKVDPDKTYLIAGGLGGIGRSLAALLIECGAQHLAFVSRSGAASPLREAFLRDLKKVGVNVGVYKCDISDANALGETLHQCSKEMPPVKGVIQSVAVLRDSIIYNMTFRQWNEALEGKLQGSWNLHEQTPRDLDFFLCLGSFIATIGSRSQSNYAAGCAFQDGLAHMRQAIGLPAVTIDLGIMKGIGIIADQGAAGDALEWRDLTGVDESELHVLVKLAIAGQMSSAEKRCPPQIINGVPTGAMVREAGVRKPYFLEDPRFAAIAAIGSQDQMEMSGGKQTALLKDQLAQCDNLPAAVHLVTGALVARVAKLMHLDLVDIDDEKPLYGYGVDSLLAIEMVQWIKRETQAEMTVFDVMSSLSLKSFSAAIIAKSNLSTGSSAAINGS
ncbi:uncharacterized protein Triagg1_10981 [Trichoderma aggressivum f. europaeum]|uniref:Polyketide synthase n=1 Tax=Trichoderma aggressivum f. europaeum TaxID=173218 RepID=A0AAE1LXP8_9HYPO|nr:hypothetical protein Triagg1_10981 [Trichoderma aggressivum f. europaeum]